MSRSVVVLPQPLGPSTAQVPPACSSRSAPSTARTAPNALHRPRSRSPTHGGTMSLPLVLPLLVAIAMSPRFPSR